MAQYIGIKTHTNLKTRVKPSLESLPSNFCFLPSKYFARHDGLSVLNAGNKDTRRHHKAMKQ
jgi:hypothetical protein